MKKTILTLLAGILLLISSASAALVTTTYSDGYCEKTQTGYVNAKFDKQFCIMPLRKTNIIVMTYKQPEAFGTTQGCELRGDCGCAICEKTYHTDMGGKQTTTIEIIKSRYRTDFVPRECIICKTDEQTLLPEPKRVLIMSY